MGKTALTSKDALLACCRELGFDLPQQALDGLFVYLDMLCQWNAVMNLTGGRTWRDVLTGLVADSFHLARFFDTLPLPVAPDGSLDAADLGAGAGLPGIPLRLVWQKGRYTMVEAREKRALFISSVLARLCLPRTAVYRGRVEDFFAARGEALGLIVSRAFMPWRELLSLAAPHLCTEGVIVMLASQAPPKAAPEGWLLNGAREYTTCGRQRWFWAFTPARDAAAQGKKGEHA
ncbi:MAG: class I SAM-dependent methyltransferase [Desulfovibrio sp.]|nr:class I SAM-dependent methyltransferase [Desulfovibrio sp.]